MFSFTSTYYLTFFFPKQNIMCIFISPMRSTCPRRHILLNYVSLFHCSLFYKPFTVNDSTILKRTIHLLVQAPLTMALQFNTVS